VALLLKNVHGRKKKRGTLQLLVSVCALDPYCVGMPGSGRLRPVPHVYARCGDHRHTVAYSDPNFHIQDNAHGDCD
jgi:hypothetical protein